MLGEARVAPGRHRRPCRPGRHARSLPPSLLQAVRGAVSKYLRLRVYEALRNVGGGSPFPPLGRSPRPARRRRVPEARPTWQCPPCSSTFRLTRGLEKGFLSVCSAHVVFVRDKCAVLRFCLSLHAGPRLPVAHCTALPGAIRSGSGFAEGRPRWSVPARARPGARPRRWRLSSGGLGSSGARAQGGRAVFAPRSSRLFPARGSVFPAFLLSLLLILSP